MKSEIQTGLDTFSYYHVLSPKQKKAILKELKVLPNFITVTDDYRLCARGDRIAYSSSGNGWSA